MGTDPQHFQIFGKAEEAEEGAKTPSVYGEDALVLPSFYGEDPKQADVGKDGSILAMGNGSGGGPGRDDIAEVMTQWASIMCSERTDVDKDDVGAVAARLDELVRVETRIGGGKAEACANARQLILQRVA